MAKSQDFTAMFKDMMGAFPVDTKAMEDAFKTSAGLSEKMSSVALEA
ncbi:MAG: phasin, PhaP, partial [Pseudomonadota bacterium]